MLFYCFLSLSLGLYAQSEAGLEPLKPSQELKGRLHTAPDEKSPSFREIQSTDQLKVLRNEGEWFEVDVRSEKGIEFRGWVRGGLPAERQAPSNLEERLKPAKADPLRSDRYFWFWSGDVEETARLSLYLGTESINFQPKGTPTGAVRTISGYNFFGFSLGGEGSLTILESTLFNREFRWLLNGNYYYSLFQVAFGNSPALPGEIQGASYRIQTHKFQIESLAEIRAFRWKQGFMRFRLGPGYTAFDDSPDLKRTNRGNVVFTQLGFSGLSSPIEVETQFANNFRITANFTPLWLTQVSENPDASASGDLKHSGMTWLAKLKFQWRWARNWSLDGHGEYFTGKAKHPGTSRRIDSNFEDVSIKLTSIRLLTGVSLHF